MATLNAVSAFASLRHDVSSGFNSPKTTDYIKRSYFIPRFPMKNDVQLFSSQDADESKIRAELSTKVPLEKPFPNHTITKNPAAPEFLPIPPFEECFPNSTKEYMYFLVHEF
jgi:hypothetical protein